MTWAGHHPPRLCLLEHQAEDLERAFPFLGRRVLPLRVDDLNRPSKRDAEAARDERQACLRLHVQRHQRRLRSEVGQDGLQPGLLVDFPEPVDAFLQSFGDRQIPRLDDVPGVRRSGLSDQEQVVDLLIDEVAGMTPTFPRAARLLGWAPYSG